MSGYQVDFSGQLETVFISVAVGAALCILYDMFRILRLTHRWSYAAVFWQDIFYCFLCAVITYGLLLVRSSGVVRVYPLIGEVIGFIICRFTLSRAVMKAASVVISAVQHILSAVNRVIFAPIYRVLRSVAEFFYNFVKKLIYLLKKHLKHTFQIVYNQVKLQRSAKKRRNEHESE